MYWKSPRVFPYSFLAKLCSVQTRAGEGSSERREKMSRATRCISGSRNCAGKAKQACALASRTCEYARGVAVTHVHARLNIKKLTTHSAFPPPPSPFTRFLTPPTYQLSSAHGTQGTRLVCTLVNAPLFRNQSPCLWHYANGIQVPLLSVMVCEFWPTQAQYTHTGISGRLRLHRPY